MEIKEYLNNKDITYRESNGELIAKCVFNNCDQDSTGNEAHLYLNAEDGRYNCKKCGESGNLKTLQKFFGDDERKKQGKLISKTDEVKKITIEKVDLFHSKMPDEIKRYLNSRGISDESIMLYKLGFMGNLEDGHITIPIKDKNDNYLYFKLRKSPKSKKSSPKYTFSPTGSKAVLFGRQFLREKPEQLFICEGEFDCIMLHQFGIPAITSTAGAETFKDEWLDELVGIKQIVLCLDNDDTGKRATKKLIQKLYEKYPTIEVSSIVFPERMKEGKDVTDYFSKYGGTPDELMQLIIKEKNPLASRVVSVPKPKISINFEEWKKVINENFPDMVFAAEIAGSIITQILIKDITNCFALILVDAPSSGKTITINFFSDIPELTYASDKFTPASFVSNSAQISKKDLGKIDLLPRLRYKMLLARDLGTMFSKSEEELTESLGILTRVLDGEGLQTDTGTHGRRGYDGEFLFMFLGASTPLRPRVWKIMGNLGSRLFFMNMNLRTKSEDELTQELMSGSYKEKEKKCREITQNYIYSLWNQYSDGITWDRTKDEESIKIIVRCTNLLRRLRGVVNKEYKPDEFGISTLLSIDVNIEQPKRILNQLYNISRSHAIFSGRNYINKEDIKYVLRLTFDSGQPRRVRLLKELLKRNGVMATSHVSAFLNKCTTPTALKAMEDLEKVGIVKMHEMKTGLVGHPESAIQLIEEFNWFLSVEFKELFDLDITEADLILEEHAHLIDES